MGKPVHSDAFFAKARVLWDEGLSARDIAKRLKVTKNAISGLAFRNKFPPRPSPIHPPPTELRERLLQSYRENPGPPIELAARLGVPRHAVNAFMRWGRKQGLIPPLLPDELRSKAQTIGKAGQRQRMGETAWREFMIAKAARARTGMRRRKSGAQATQ